VPKTPLGRAFHHHGDEALSPPPSWGLGLLCWLAEVWLDLPCCRLVPGASSCRLPMAIAVPRATPLLPSSAGAPPVAVAAVGEKAGARRWLQPVPGQSSVSLMGPQGPTLGTSGAEVPVALDLSGICWGSSDDQDRRKLSKSVYCGLLKGNAGAGGNC